MLVLSRKVGERIVLPDCGVTVTVLAIRGNVIRLGVSAPVRIEVHREEIWKRLGGEAGRSTAREPLRNP